MDKRTGENALSPVHSHWHGRRNGQAPFLGRGKELVQGRFDPDSPGNQVDQGEAHDLAVMREELQNIRRILEFAHVPKYTVKIVDGKHIKVPFDRSRVFSPSEAEQE